MHVSVLFTRMHSCLDRVYLKADFEVSQWIANNCQKYLKILLHASNPQIFRACGAKNPGSLRSPGQLEYLILNAHVRAPGPPCSPGDQLTSADCQLTAS